MSPQSELHSAARRIARPLSFALARLLAGTPLVAQQQASAPAGAVGGAHS